MPRQFICSPLSRCFSLSCGSNKPEGSNRIVLKISSTTNPGTFTKLVGLCRRARSNSAPVLHPSNYIYCTVNNYSKYHTNHPYNFARNSYILWQPRCSMIQWKLPEEKELHNKPPFSFCSYQPPVINVTC